MSTDIDPIIIDMSESTPCVPSRDYTADDLLRMPDEGQFDLVGGRLVERVGGAEGSYVSGQILFRVGTFLKARQMGVCFAANCGYQVFSKPNQVLYPSGSFVSASRLREIHIPKGHMRIAPDIAIEVVDPHVLAGHLQFKICEYLRVGVSLIWVAYPSFREILVFRHGTKTIDTLNSADTLTGGDVLPGFSVPVAELFPPVAAEPQAAS